MKHWTDTTDEEAVVFFDRLSEPEIRRRQSLCDQQLVMAVREYRHDAMADLERMRVALQESMLRRLYRGIV